MPPSPLRLLPIALLLLSACGVKPGVRLEDLRTTALNSTTTEVAASMILDNPNSSPLEVQGADYRLYLEGTYVGQGQNDFDLVIPGRDEAPQTVTLRLENRAALPLLKRAGAGEGLSYKIEGNIVRKGGRKMRVNVQGKLEPAR